MTTKSKRFLILSLALLLLAGAGVLWSAGIQLAKSSQAGTADRAKTLYTCGMHPQIIQDHPGNCPICGMRLTKMKRATAGAAAANPSGQRKIKYWRAPMDPTYISDKPGKSPMGMDLIPVYEDEAAQADSSAIAIDPVTIQDMGLRTGLVTCGPLRRVIRTVGMIDYNEAGLADVTTKFKGWIEKLYVDTTGQQVHRGDPLFEIYSPELYSAEVEYLLSRRTATRTPDAEANSLQASARQKLQYWDISDDQIAELEKSGKPRKTLQVLAPIDGFVTEKDVVEGQMVNAGMKIYRLADLSLVWMQGEIYEQDLPYVKLGQEAVVTLSYLPDRKFHGRVTYIYPYLDQKTRTVRVRMEFHNPGFFLKPGMFASVELHAQLAPSAVLVPDSAVLRSGQKNTVFVALDGGRFAPRSVVLGPRSENDMYQVVSGLKAGERVVTSGQFMLDSESQLREALQKMTEPAKTSSGPAASPQTNAPQEKVAPESNAIVYVCPMPEHVSIEFDHPGKCPICGMTLIPVNKSTLEKMHLSGKVLYYTCPMPEHANIHEAKPGRCPECGMTLIPVMSPLAERGAPGARSGGSVGSVERGSRASSLDTPHSQRSTPQGSTNQVLYTCPMPEHADVVSDKPGKCPKCEMDLVPTSAVAHGKKAEANWRGRHPVESVRAPVRQSAIMRLRGVAKGEEPE